MGEEAAYLFLLDAALPGALRKQVRKSIRKAFVHSESGTTGAVSRQLWRCMASLIRRIERRTLWMRFRLRILVGGPLESARTHNRHVSEHAKRKYVPQPYPGPAVLWYTQKEYLKAWENLVTGAFKTRWIDGRHLDLYRDEYCVRQWAPELASDLEAIHKQT